MTAPQVVPTRTKGELPLSDLRLKLYERALDRDPRNHFLLLDLAREYGRHRRFVDAERMLQRLVEHYPRCAQVRTQAAAAFVDIGLPQQAIEHYRCSLELDPNQPDATAIVKELARLTASLRSPAVG